MIKIQTTVYDFLPGKMNLLQTPRHWANGYFSNRTKSLRKQVPSSSRKYTEASEQPGVILIKLAEIGRSKNKRSSFPDHRIYTLSSMRTGMKHTIVEYRAISFAHPSFWLLWEIDGNWPSLEATITELYMLFACIQTVHNKSVWRDWSKETFAS